MSHFGEAICRWSGKGSIEQHGVGHARYISAD